MVVLAGVDVFATGPGHVEHTRGEPGDMEYGIKMVEGARLENDLAERGIRPTSVAQFIRRDSFKVLLPGVTLTDDSGEVW